MDTSKIIIGSAQFGMEYGIANNYKRVPHSQIEEILSYAKKSNINLIDTASLYGNSENTLGKLASDRFNFITKLRPYNNSENVSDYVVNCFEQSLSRLQVKKCYGLLVHHADDLLSDQGPMIYQALNLLKYQNKVKKIGASVYNPEQALELIDRYQIDILQFPVNLLDKRFLKNEIITAFKSKKIELHARSMFLQGLLLMDLNKIPSYFDELKDKIGLLDDECKSLGVSRRKMLIDYICSLTEIDYYVFGVDDVIQLADIITDFEASSGKYEIMPDQYQCANPLMINPSLWRFRSA